MDLENLYKYYWREFKARSLSLSLLLLPGMWRIDWWYCVCVCYNFEQGLLLTCLLGGEYCIWRSFVRLYSAYKLPADYYLLSCMFIWEIRIARLTAND